MKDFFITIANDIINITPNIFWATIILIFGFWLSKIVRKLIPVIAKNYSDFYTFFKQLAHLISALIQIIIILIITNILGLDKGIIQTILLGFFLILVLTYNSNIKNLLSGLNIIISKTFKKSDLIEIEGFRGYVTDLQLFNTHLLISNGKSIIIPNSKIINSVITHASKLETIRIHINFKSDNSIDLSELPKIIYNITKNNPKIITENPVEIEINSEIIKDVICDIFLYCFVQDFIEIRDYMIENLKKQFDCHFLEVTTI